LKAAEVKTSPLVTLSPVAKEILAYVWTHRKEKNTRDAIVLGLLEPSLRKHKVKLYRGIGALVRCGLLLRVRDEKQDPVYEIDPTRESEIRTWRVCDGLIDVFERISDNNGDEPVDDI
jgi:hypothetical protein